MADLPTIDVTFKVIHADAFLDYNNKVLNKRMTLVDAIFPTDLQTFLNAKGTPLADNVSPADSIVVLVGADIAQALSDTATSSDNVVRDLGPGLSEVLTGTDVIAKAVGKPLAEALTVTDAIAIDHGVPLVDSVTVTDGVTAIIPASAWNPSDKVRATLSSGNRKSTIDMSGTTGGTRAVTGRSTGKFYFALSIDVLDGSSAFEALGVKLAGGSPNDARGLVASEAGMDINDGRIQSNGNLLFTDTSPVPGDIVGFAVDLDAGQFFVALNGTWYNAANPTTGLRAFGGLSAGSTYYPAMSGKNGTSMTFVTGSPPTGFASWN